MECPNCRKQLADNAKACPDCGYDFTDAIKKKQTAQGCLVLLLLLLVIIFCFVIFLNLLFSDEDKDVPQNVSKEENKFEYTDEQIKIANDFIITIEATGLIKEIKNDCADGSKGCYQFIIDDNLWANATTFETKRNILNASEIYSSTKTPYKFFKGVGYYSGKTLYDIWGVK